MAADTILTCGFSVLRDREGLCCWGAPFTWCPEPAAYAVLQEQSSTGELWEHARCVEHTAQGRESGGSRVLAVKTYRSRG